MVVVRLGLGDDNGLGKNTFLKVGSFVIMVTITNVVMFYAVQLMNSGKISTYFINPTMVTLVILEYIQCGSIYSETNFTLAIA